MYIYITVVRTIYRLTDRVVNIGKTTFKYCFVRQLDGKKKKTSIGIDNVPDKFLSRSVHAQVVLTRSRAYELRCARKKKKSV